MKISGKDIQYDSKAFNELFEWLFPSMCMLASRILKDESKGKDIAQEAFVKLWEKDQKEFADENALKAYLYVLVKNACISHIRSEKKIQKTSLEEGESVEDDGYLEAVLREETYVLLHEAIKKLSPQAEQVVLLALKGMKNQEIAGELNITLNSVKTVKKRAYKAMRESLGSQFVMILLTDFIHFF